MKSLFNEAEKFLIQRWADSRLLEDSMKEVRKKYQEIGERIVDKVQSAHPELVSFEESGEVCMWLPAPSRAELRSTLLEGDGRPFVDLIVGQFQKMTTFIPALDKLFLKAT